MTELWKELQGYLSLAFDAEIVEKAGEEPDAVVKFSVSNTASPPQQGRPEIVFENVVLKVGVSPDWHETALGTIQPGESIVHEHRCTLSALPDLEFDITSTISPEAFFSSNKRGRFPGSGVALSLASYIYLFNDMDVHRWLNSTLRHFPIPGPDTTMSEVQSMIESLNQPIEETRDAQDRLKRIATFVDSSNRLSREALVEHGNLVHPYLMEVQKGIGQIRQSLGSPDGQRLSALLEQIVVNLDSLAARVDEATEGLLKI